MAFHLGIDLGTSNSAVVGNRDGRLRLYKTADGTDVLPSAIHIDRRGHRLYGKRAYDQAVLSPENVAQRFKRLMGTSTPFRFAAAGIEMTPEACSANILRQLVAQALTESGEIEAEATVVTVPAAFNQMQSEATIRAAQAAGLGHVGLLQEPIAAAMAAMAEGKSRSGVFLVYDIGGGTFDVALVQSVSGSVSVLAHEGINMLGGGDFDTMIVNQVVRPWLLNNFDLPEDFQRDPKLKKVISIARLAAEQAKIGLSTQTREQIQASEDMVRATDRAGKDIYLDIPIERSVLEALVRPRLEETVPLCQSLIEASGYGREDVERVVMIGGPSKMPLARRMVEDQLGIPIDIQVDPMTAVAIGAAIFAESREWLTGPTARKASRASVTSGTAVRLRYSYPARMADERAKLHVWPETSGAEAAEIEVASEEGWASGRARVGAELVMDLGLPSQGEHRFIIRVFGPDGRPLPEAGVRIAITRTHASAAGIPATQTIAVKVLEQVGGDRHNRLHSLVAKGTLLPAEGVEHFRAATDLRSDHEGQIGLELYQQAEGVPEPELNLFVGSFRITSSDLSGHERIRRGDEVVCRWRMDDNGLLGCTLDMPSIGRSFETGRYYADTAGHRSFEGEEGDALARHMLGTAAEELDGLDDALGEVASPALDRLRDRLARQRQALADAADADSRRSVTEGARHIRQEMSRLRHDPNNRAAVLSGEVEELRRSLRRELGGDVDPALERRFAQLLENAGHELAMNNPTACDEAERLLRQARTLKYRELFERPDFLKWYFNQLAGQPHLAVDRELFTNLIRQGQQAAHIEDWSTVRRTIGEFLTNRVEIAAADQPAFELATLSRG